MLKRLTLGVVLLLAIGLAAKPPAGRTTYRCMVIGNPPMAVCGPVVQVAPTAALVGGKIVRW